MLRVAEDSRREESCPYCKQGLAALPETICPGCQTKIHQECWDTNRGCTTLGCSSQSVQGAIKAFDAGNVSFDEHLAIKVAQWLRSSGLVVDSRDLQDVRNRKALDVYWRDPKVTYEPTYKPNKARWRALIAATSVTWILAGVVGWLAMEKYNFPTIGIPAFILFFISLVAWPIACLAYSTLDREIEESIPALVYLGILHFPEPDKESGKVWAMQVFGRDHDVLEEAKKIAVGCSDEFGAKVHCQVISEKRHHYNTG